MVKCTKRQIRQLKTALHWKMPEAQRQRIQMILLRESGMAQPAIADAMGVSLSTVNRAHMAYDHGGIKALKPKPSGGRKRENMTLAEERTLLRLGESYIDLGPLRERASALHLRSCLEIRDGVVPENGIGPLMQSVDLIVFPYRQIDASGVFFTALHATNPLSASALGPSSASSASMGME